MKFNLFYMKFNKVFLLTKSFYIIIITNFKSNLTTQLWPSNEIDSEKIKMMIISILKSLQVIHQNFNTFLYLSKQNL